MVRQPLAGPLYALATAGMLFTLKMHSRIFTRLQACCIHLRVTARVLLLNPQPWDNQTLYTADSLSSLTMKLSVRSTQTMWSKRNPHLDDVGLPRWRGRQGGRRGRCGGGGQRGSRLVVVALRVTDEVDGVGVDCNSVQVAVPATHSDIRHSGLNAMQKRCSAKPAAQLHVTQLIAETALLGMGEAR